MQLSQRFYFITQSHKTKKQWRSSADNGSVFGALLNDVSREFDCLTHERPLVKLCSYAFDLNSLRLIRGN